MGETRVDLVRLLEDLADAYPGDLEETVLTEIVANALDSGARTIALTADAAAAALTVHDDGAGMRRVELRRFHDLATSTKQRGEGIGFAGVGIKLGLLLSDEVVTETRRGTVHTATSWTLTNRRRAPWRWISPAGLVATNGTAVRMRLSNALSPLLDAGYLESTLRRHFEPLFDPYFRGILRAHYPNGVQFAINGAPVAEADVVGEDTSAIELRLPRKRTPSAFGYMMRADTAVSEERRGIAVSTYGKVIKRGWDWLGVTPATADRITGLIEAPALATALTLNKSDFVRAGPRGALYLSYRKALQEAVMTQLATWGDAPESDDRTRRRAARPVERDLEAILLDLADDFPLLATLVEKRAGGRGKMSVASGRGIGVGEGVVGASAIEPAADLFAAPAEPPPSAGPIESSSEGRESRTAGDAMPPTTSVVDGTRGRSTKRPMRLGLTIQFESRAGDPMLARLVESTVWVNDAHPAHRRAVASRSEGYHLALSVAMALADVAVEPANEGAFIAEFLARWGESVDRRPRRGARRPRAPKRGQ